MGGDRLWEPSRVGRGDAGHIEVGSVLRHGGDHYVWVTKPPESLTGTCQRLEMTLNDGSVHAATSSSAESHPGLSVARLHSVGVDAGRFDRLSCLLRLDLPRQGERVQRGGGDVRGVDLEMTSQVLSRVGSSESVCAQ